jgi:hypothetical protein
LQLIVPAFGISADILKLLPETSTGLANKCLDLRFEVCRLRGVGHTPLSLNALDDAQWFAIFAHQYERGNTFFLRERS